MMDLRSFETRRLIDKGLEIMNDGNKPFQNTFLAEFVVKQSYSLGSSVTPIGMAFYIAPFINSTVRVGTLEERIGLFEAMLEEKANEMVPSTKRGAKGEMEKFSIEAARIATNVKNRQKREEDKGAIAFAEHVNEEYLNKNSIIVLDTGGTVVKDLNGLIANQMQSKFQRPALVISRKDGFVSGSGRGYESNVMTDFRQFINESGLAEYAEGHAQAFGVKFTEENFQRFIEYANANLDYAGAFKEYEADFIMEGPEIDSELVLELAKLKNFWGKGMEEPLIAFRNVPISTSDKFAMANNTLKLMAKDVPCIKFRAGEGAFEELAPNEYTISLVDIVGKTNLNEFNGRTSGQIFVTEYEIVDTKMNF
jgi:single-stranded-DNA-specific exonuclease